MLYLCPVHAVLSTCSEMCRRAVLKHSRHVVLVDRNVHMQRWRRERDQTFYQEGYDSRVYEGDTHVGEFGVKVQTSNGAI